MAILEDTTSLEIYLAPAEFLNSDHPSIIEFARKHSRHGASDIENAISLYEAARDEIIYTPYWNFNDMETFRASNCLVTGKGMCQSKAAFLAASARAVGIPARIGFADVTNHMSSQKFLDLLGTNIFYWHAYTDLYLNGKWVKATPAFDSELCKSFNVAPLEFNGQDDSLFQALNSDNKKFMEYVGDHGTFPDLPVAQILSELRLHYPNYFKKAEDQLGTPLKEEVDAEK